MSTQSKSFEAQSKQSEPAQGEFLEAQSDFLEAQSEVSTNSDCSYGKSIGTELVCAPSTRLCTSTLYQ